MEEGGGTYVCNFAYDLRDLECNGFTICHHRLDCTGTDHMPQGCLGTFNKGLMEICNSKCSSVRVVDLEVDDRITMREIRR